jgi:hypothetical protein
MDDDLIDMLKRFFGKPAMTTEIINNIFDVQSLPTGVVEFPLDIFNTKDNND